MEEREVWKWWEEYREDLNNDTKGQKPIIKVANGLTIFRREYNQTIEKNDKD